MLNFFINPDAIIPIKGKKKNLKYRDSERWNKLGGHLRFDIRS